MELSGGSLPFLSSGAPVPRCPPGLGPLLLLKDAFCLERGDSCYFCAPHPVWLLGKADNKQPCSTSFSGVAPVSKNFWAGRVSTCSIRGFTLF